ncbi:MAG: dihydropteroate synthase [Chloroflexi bacterium]|nr:dihydropteroate synthase [Chloroflexota bacterium]
MQTRISGAAREVVIGDGQPTVLIGEGINPSGRKTLTAQLKAGSMELVRKLAMAQVQAGADVVDVNVGIAGGDQVALLPRAVLAVTETVDVPLCLDSDNPAALEAALKVYRGKPLVNSVSGRERSLQEVLPLVKEYGAAVIGLTMDDSGIPQCSEGRGAIARKIVERAELLGIPREDIVIDCAAMSVGTDVRSGLAAIEAIGRIKAELGVNMTLGTSNISFGLPDRNVLNTAFLAIAIAAGVTCPIVDIERVRPIVLAADLVLGRDNYAMRYIKAYRQRQKADVQ